MLYLDEKRIIERLGQDLTGIYPRIGGFTTGSGFALGVGLRHALPGTNDFEIDCRPRSRRRPTSPRFPRAGAVAARGLAGARRRHTLVGLHAGGLLRARRVVTRPIAPTIATSALGVNLVARVRPLRWFSFGEDVGYLRPDIDDGTDDRFPVDRRLLHRRRGARPGAPAAPGLQRAASSTSTIATSPATRAGAAACCFQIGTGRDQDPSREFSYRRTDLEVMHVFPIFDKKRNFAVRFAAAHVDPLNADGRVAFFLSPTIGGSRTVRSYRAQRFRDATYVLTERRVSLGSLLGPRPRALLGWRRRRHHARTDSARRVQDRLGLRPAVQHRSPDLHADRRRVRRAAKGARFFWKFSPAF